MPIRVGGTGHGIAVQMVMNHRGPGCIITTSGTFDDKQLDAMAQAVRDYLIGMRRTALACDLQISPKPGGGFDISSRSDAPVTDAQIQAITDAIRQQPAREQRSA